MNHPRRKLLSAKSQNGTLPFKQSTHPLFAPVSTRQLFKLMFIPLSQAEARAGHG